MLGKDTPPKHPLVAGRTCGSCNVCCVALTIDDPELQKPQGIRCRNARPDNSCAVYDNRPRTCRGFYCGWRLFKWIREPLRPDRSGVLVRLHIVFSKETGARKEGVIFTLLTAAALKADGLAESIAAAVAADVPVFLHVPGPPGHTASQVQINEVLQDAVITKNKPEVLKILRDIRAMGRTVRHERIVSGRRGPSDATQPPNA